MRITIESSQFIVWYIWIHWIFYFHIDNMKRLQIVSLLEKILENSFID